MLICNQVLLAIYGVTHTQYYNGCLIKISYLTMVSYMSYNIPNTFQSRIFIILLISCWMKEHNNLKTIDSNVFVQHHSWICVLITRCQCTKILMIWFNSHVPFFWPDTMTKHIMLKNKSQKSFSSFQFEIMQH